MADKTGIEWTDSTWNPIRGCSRVSEGCRNCYAEGVARRFSGPGLPYEGLVRIGGDGKPHEWNGNIRFVEEHLLDPLKWQSVVEHTDACEARWWVHRERLKMLYPNRAARRDGCECPTRPRRIFVNSMSDLFHENVTDEMRDRIFAVMALCPQHIFQILTKRTERMLKYLHTGPLAAAGVREAYIGRQVSVIHLQRTGEPVSEWSGLPLPNVWLGVSVEDQEAADERIPLLLQTPAAVRFLSCEPLLGAINLHSFFCRFAVPGDAKDSAMAWDSLASAHCKPREERKVDWVIVGGESGAHARPMHPDWVRGLRDQCAAAAVPFFFKQWGEWLPWEPEQGCCWASQNGKSEDHHALFPENIADNPRGWDCGLGFEDESHAVFQRIGKKAAGHLLDGVEHHAFPEVR